MQDDTTSNDIQQPSDEAIENIDLVSNQSNQSHSEASTDTTTTNEQDIQGKSSQQNPDETTNQATDLPEKAQNQQEKDGENPDEKERNREFAERRIAAREEEKARLEALRKRGKENFVGELDESKYDRLREEFGEDIANMAKQNDQIAIDQRNQQLDTQLDNIQRDRETISLSVDRAELAIPMFNPSNRDEYQEELHKDALASYAEAYMETEEDENGNLFIIGLKKNAPSPLEYLTQKAEMYKKHFKKIEARAQSNAQHNRLSAETPSSGASTTTSVDPIDDFEEKFGNIPVSKL